MLYGHAERCGYRGVGSYIVVEFVVVKDHLERVAHYVARGKSAVSIHEEFFDGLFLGSEIHYVVDGDAERIDERLVACQRFFETEIFADHIVNRQRAVSFSREFFRVLIAVS